MSEFAGKKKSKKAGGRNRVKNGPGHLDSKESIAESPQVKKMDQLKAPPVTPGCETDQFNSLPATPHRVFRGFNDSVDNVNLEDIRDMLPEDVWRDVHPEGFDGGETPRSDNIDTTFVDGSQNTNGMLNAIVEEPESPASPPSSPIRDDADVTQNCASLESVHLQEGADFISATHTTEPLHTTAGTAEEEVELELLSTEECSSGAESLLGDTEDRIRDASAHQDGSKRFVSDLYDPKYRYGPAIAKKRRGVKSVFSGEASPGGRSYVEVAEAVVITVMDAVRPVQRPPTSRAESSAKPAGMVSASEERASGLGRRVRGALGYVLHTVLSLVYAVFVQYPLELLLTVLGLWWSATSAVLAAGFRGVKWLFGVYVWCLFLPVRLLERSAVLLWQKTLSLAVQFLNTHPAAGNTNDADRHSSKHTIPTALNGHAHKH